MLYVRQAIQYRDDIPLEGKEPVTIAVLDSGIETRHPDFQGVPVMFRDFLRGRDKPYDDYGHGTHICGIICGTGKASGGKYRGLCRRVRVIVLKILDAQGAGDSQVLYEALSWLYEHQAGYNIRLINISLGGKEDGGKLIQERISRLLDALWNRGVCVVCAAGNAGPAPNSISFIGRGEKRICVGCHDGSRVYGTRNCCAYFSSRGAKGGNPKPDLVAPGTGIVSCNARYAWQRGAPPYAAQNGTSMATAVVSGVLCNMFLMNRNLGNNQMKDILMYTAQDLGEEPWVQGRGMVNYKNILTHMV